MSRVRPGRNKILGQFIARPVEMLGSPAYRVLSLSGHRILSRIEVEQASHAGTENGKLPVTYDDFEEYGIHRHAISSAIDEVVALGFVEITQRGRGGNAEFRLPHKFRLTYLNSPDGWAPTHEWRKFKTLAEAGGIALAARSIRKNQKSSGGKCRVSVAETDTENTKSPVAETATTVSVRKPPLLSISRIGAGQSVPSLWLHLLSRSPDACALLIGSSIGEQQNLRRAAKRILATQVGAGSP